MVERYALLEQKRELTEYHIYQKLSERSVVNKSVLQNIARFEKRHYDWWKEVTNQDVQPYHFHIWWYLFLARLFGITFSLKLMERRERSFEKRAQGRTKYHDVFDRIGKEHHKEDDMLHALKDERVEYAGEIVLGLNDALVELTGALAGLTFALSNTKIIALSGIVTGVAASLSMAASGYLQSRENNEEKSALRGAVYTGIAYIITVAILVTPYLVTDNKFVALPITLACMLLIIISYTYYIATAKSLSFWRRFLEMAAISLGVAVISFGVGHVLKQVLGVGA